MEWNDNLLIHRLKKRDERTFEFVFKKHFRSLHGYAFSILGDDMQAEESVQNVFFRVWDRSDKLNISGSLEAYLFRAVHNEALNYLKHMKVREEHRLYVSHHFREGNSGEPVIMNREVENRIRSALEELPEQCRTIFQLSRFEELRYREIAERMGLSVKTIENQMGKALRILRARLADLLVLFIWLSQFKH